MAARDLPRCEDPEELRDLARQCRRLAGGGSTAEVRRCFNDMASEYERKAASRDPPDEPAPPPAAK